MNNTTISRDPDVSTLTDGQERLMSILGVITGCLSIFGSSLIVFRVFKIRGSTTPYDRTMLGLSIADLFASFSYGFGPFLLPEETSTRPWAAGNKTTCNFLGFMSQMAFSAVWYNGLLSFYYLITVRLGVKRSEFARKYEIPMHVFSILFFLGTSIAGLAIDLYSELEITQGCWIGEFPANCEEEENCKSTWIGWIYAGFPFVTVYLCLPINNLLIFRYVRRKLGTSTNGALTPREEAQKLRVQEVAQQGFLYVLCFYVSYTPAAVIRVLEGFGMDGEKESDIYPVLLLNSLLLPLQGWFNVFIYLKPNYLRVRNAYPEENAFWVMRLCILESEIPSLAAGFGSTTGKSSFPGKVGSSEDTEEKSLARERSRTKSIEVLDHISEASCEGSEVEEPGSVPVLNTRTPVATDSLQVWLQNSARRRQRMGRRVQPSSLTASEGDFDETGPSSEFAGDTQSNHSTMRAQHGGIPHAASRMRNKSSLESVGSSVGEEYSDTWETQSSTYSTTDSEDETVILGLNDRTAQSHLGPNNKNRDGNERVPKTSHPAKLFCESSLGVYSEYGEASSVQDVEIDSDSSTSISLGGKDHEYKGAKARWGKSKQDLSSWAPIQPKQRCKSSMIDSSSLEAISELDAMSFRPSEVDEEEYSLPVSDMVPNDEVRWQRITSHDNSPKPVERVQSIGLSRTDATQGQSRTNDFAPRPAQRFASPQFKLHKSIT